VNATTLIVTYVIAFLLGSIPWGVIISKLFYKTDIRELGSGNIGATNALRTLGKAGGAAVFVLDFAKGILSAAIAIFIYLTFVDPGSSGLGFFALKTSPFDAQSILATAVCGCTMGHIFSPWLGFKGGKGIAVAVGCSFVALGWLPTVLAIAVFAVVVALTRYVSMGSTTAAVLFPFLSLWIFWGNTYAILMCTIVGLLVIWAHVKNIRRLLDGTEARVGKKRD